MSDWHRVKTTDFYGEYEDAPGMKISNAQRVAVRWPDGSMTVELLGIVDGRGSAQVDMNNYPDYFATRKLFACRNERGVMSKIPLLGLEISRIKAFHRQSGAGSSTGNNRARSNKKRGAK